MTMPVSTCGCPLCSGKYRDKHLLLLSEVAELIRRDIDTVRRYIAEGLLEGHNPSKNGRGLTVTAHSVHKYFTAYVFTGERDTDTPDLFEGKQIPPVPDSPPLRQVVEGRSISHRRTRSGWVTKY